MSLPFFNSSIISGSTAHNLGGCGGGCLPVGGWVELGRTTLSCAADNITVSCLADKRYYMVLGNKIASGSSDMVWRVGNSTVDTLNNYASRYSIDGCADGTQTSNNKFRTSSPNTVNEFQVAYIANRSANEKLFIGHTVNEAAAGEATAPSRRETVAKWTNTSNPIDVIQGVQQDTGDFASGSEVVVLGWDESDTHTNNFWQELTDDTLACPAQTLTSSSVTAKKYNWIQIIAEYSASNNMYLRLGNSTIDTGSNYAYRKSKNDEVDVTTTGASTGVRVIDNTNNSRYFVNLFFINNASNEKLITGHSIEQNTAGAANAPDRFEFVGKWDNTSNQADICQLYSDSGNMASGARIKWWGAD